MNSVSAPIYTDFQGMAELKARAHADAKGSLDKVARQFESLFTQMMLKSMRQAKLGDGLMDSDQTKFYQEMYDQQLALHLSESGGIGLTEVIKSQLGGSDAANDSQPVNSFSEYRNSVIGLMDRRSGPPISLQDGKPIIALGQSPVVEQGSISQLRQPSAEKPESKKAAAVTTDPKSWKKQDFVQQLWPWAREAAEKLGVAPAALLAQAALETGWGRHIMPSGKRGSANNLFGIKSGRGWRGDSVSLGTLEFEQGVAVRKRDSFRSYDTLRDSFNDYVDFLRSNPRYSKALESTADSKQFFQELQKAGYATDPHYADKLTRVMESKDMQLALQRLKDSGNGPL
jgi:peptidoglycan hydrolase FlgJ